MQCPRCHQETTSDAEFCSQCGGKLAIVCLRCGTINPLEHKFCKECGQHLVAASGVRATKYQNPEYYIPEYLAERVRTSASLEDERKQVTVLFADIKSSLELIADRDPEDASKILDGVLQLMIAAVHQYEGTVNRVMGDGIMALFGAPVALENHAVRACYAALLMQRTIERFSEEARRTLGLYIQVRIGVNSGEVIVRSIRSDLQMDYAAVGESTHLAARMEQIATPGSILITANVMSLTRGYIEVKHLGLLPVKGLRAPVEVFELIGAGPVQSRLQAAAARGLTPFVGRSAEIEALREALEQTRAGHGQVVAIVGEAGVGKSRLLHEFIHSSYSRGWLVLESDSVSHGRAVPYFPMSGFLKNYFNIDPRDDTPTVREKLTGKVLMLDQFLQETTAPLLYLLEALPNDHPFHNLEPTQRREHTAQAIKRLVLAESRLQPAIIVFEDLQWCDSASLGVLDNLVDNLGDSRVLLVVSYRPEHPDDWGRSPYYRKLWLTPLTRESVDKLLNALLGVDSTLGGLKELLIEQTEGNPFFIEEMVRMLIETQVLRGEPGRRYLAQPISSIQVPPMVQDVIASRIDRLPPQEKRVIREAAVIGRHVSFKLLQMITDLPEAELRGRLAYLQDGEFLYETQLFPDLEHTFKHALTHQVTYAGLLHDTRREIHARVMECIEKLHSDRLGEHVDRLAHHAFLGEDWAKAVTYLQQAGAKAFARSVHREAVRCFEDALTALSHLPETRETLEQAIDLRFDLRNALLPLVEWGRIEGYLREAEALARKFNDQRRLASVSGYMSGLHLNTGGRASDVRAFAEEVEAIGASLHDVPLQVAASYYHVWLGALSGDYRGTERLCRTLMDALPGDLSRKRFGLVAYPAVVARAFLARALAELGVFDEGRDHGEEAVRLAEALDHPFSLIWACLNLGRLEGLRGEFTRASMPIERAVALSHEWNIAYLTPIALAALGHVYARSGRVEEGVSRLQQALAGYASAGIGYLRSMSTVQLGEAHLLAGRVEEAWDFGTRAAVLARERGERGHEAWAHRLLGETASQRDCPDVTAAEAHYATCTGLAVELSMRPLVAHCHFGVGKLHGRAGDRRATEDLATAMSLFHEMGMRFWFEKAEAEMQALEPIASLAVDIAVSPP
jgi:class 3 adenylate cyclase/tetratricopeptide (TPR) repeat protein